MPLYDYRCDACGHIFDKILRIDDRMKPTEEPCPECGEPKVGLHIFIAQEVIDPVRLGRLKPHSDWRHFITKLKQNTKGAADFNTF